MVQIRKTGRYTHLAKIYGIKCYYNVYAAKYKGTNWINDKMIKLLKYLDGNLTDYEYFSIKIIKELN